MHAVLLTRIPDKLHGMDGRYPSVKGWRTLDEATARALVAMKVGGLFLEGLETLDPEVARIFASSRARQIRLNKLSSLDEATAEQLARFGGTDIQLNGLDSLSAEVAAKLRQQIEKSGKLRPTIQRSPGEHNANYLDTKKSKLGHML